MKYSFLDKNAFNCYLIHWQAARGLPENPLMTRQTDNYILTLITICNCGSLEEVEWRYWQWRSSGKAHDCLRCAGDHLVNVLVWSGLPPSPPSSLSRQSPSLTRLALAQVRSGHCREFSTFSLHSSLPSSSCCYVTSGRTGSLSPPLLRHGPMTMSDSCSHPIRDGPARVRALCCVLSRPRCEGT